MHTFESIVKRYDGEDEIVFSGVFNVYENSLKIKELAGFNFEFIFENKLPVLPLTNPPKDILVSGKDKDITIVLTAKLRNALGSGTANKIPVVTFDDGRTLLFSLYSSEIGNNTLALNVTITFYIR